MLQRSGARAGGRRSGALGVSLLVALGIVAAACVPVAPPPLPPTLEISTTPGMFPAFNPSSTDYVSRCNGTLTVSIGAPEGTAVSVNYQPWQAGFVDQTLSLADGQSAVIAVLPPSGPEVAYWIRCLPADFANFTVQQNAPSQAAGFVAKVNGPNSSRCAVFNSQGVPVWWSPNLPSFFCTLLPDGNVAWTFNGNLEEHALDGSLLQTITPPNGGVTDAHDLLQLPNNDYVLVANTTRTGVDLSGELGSGHTTDSISDPVIEEFTSTGTLVGSWDTADHIPVSEWDPQWYSQMTPCSTGGTCHDVYHWNSIEYTGSGFIVSYRHLDAVYDINFNASINHLESSDAIGWKLGSYSGGPSTTAPNLTVTSDPVFTPSDPSTCAATPDPCHFGGQHDARLNPDGSVSLYDDGTGLGRAPRAVRYTIDTTAMTATYQESVTDSSAPGASPCCGSARKLTTGDWVIGWGGTNVATENQGDGTEVLRWDFESGTLVYRMVPLTAAQFDLDALRQGMESQYATAASAHSETSPSSAALPP